MGKPIILTNFGYHRKNWVELIESISDEYEIIYIHFVKKDDEYAKHTDAKVLYFSDYKHAFDLLEQIRPSIFISMGLGSSYMISVKYACKRLKIPYYYMDHGLYGHSQDYINEKLVYESRNLKSVIDINKIENIDNKRSSDYSFVFKTFLRSFDILMISKLILFEFIKKTTKKNNNKIPFYKRLSHPDGFLTYSELNMARNQEVYSPQKDSIFYIGNFEYDKFRIPPSPKEEDYLLLIDNAISDNPYNKLYVTTEEHIEIYNQINLLAQKEGLKLKIKLHPYNYFSKWIPNIDNVDFIKNCDINSLIKNASYCVSFRSTLLIPALYFSKTIILSTFNNSIEDFIRENNICNIYNVYNLNIEDIQFTDIVANKNEAFVKNFFDLNEETSTNRLKKAIKQIFEKSH
ncbi:MAG: hypothetical protein M9887_09630 [Chitinophagales bacterium]|nr:hypothetical protein [Chitinophagales bacterium]